MTEKITIETVRAWFSPKNWSDLGITANRSLDTLKTLIPWARVIDARFFPQFIDEHLFRVHLLFITEKILYHAFLGTSKFIYTEYPIIDIRCRVEFIFASDGKRIDNTCLYFDIGELTADGRPRIHYLEIPARGRAHAVQLVSLINQLKAKEYGDYED